MKIKILRYRKVCRRKKHKASYLNYYHWLIFITIYETILRNNVESTSWSTILVYHLGLPSWFTILVYHDIYEDLIRSNQIVMSFEVCPSRSKRVRTQMSASSFFVKFRNTSHFQ